MIRYIIFLLLYLLIISCAKDAKNVIVQVKSDDVDPSYDRIYITGNHEILGDWDPSKIHLTFNPETKLWSTDLKVHPETKLEFKLTKGSWLTEALTDDAKVRSNYSVTINRDTTIYLEVQHWKNVDILAGISGEADLYKDMLTPGLSVRHVIVRLPPSYNIDSNSRYPVLYLHDGQNVFNPYTSYTGKDWRVDEVSDSLARLGLIEEVIVVAVYNTQARTNEYSYLDEGNKYVSWLVSDLKPFIDSIYRTKTDAKNTAVMGSSMGGLISFIISWEYPDVFGKAACLSPALDIPRYELSYVPFVVNDTLPKRDIIFYLDNGTEGIDSELQPGIDRMMELLDNKGYDYMWYLDQNAEHNEAAWAARVHKPLLFLFGKD